MRISNGLTAASLIAAALIITTPLQAAQARLIGVASQPYDVSAIFGLNLGPAIPEIPGTAADLAALTDADTSTAYTFTSHAGEFYPNATVGFITRFDFDVSDYESIDRIDFTWTGLLTWTGAAAPFLRVGHVTGNQIVVTPEFLIFGTFYEPDFIAKTAVRSYIAGSDDFGITKVVHDGVASIWVETDEAFTMAALDNLSIATLEVAADVTGTEAP